MSRVWTSPFAGPDDVVKAAVGIGPHGGCFARGTSDEHREHHAQGLTNLLGPNHGNVVAVILEAPLANRYGGEYGRDPKSRGEQYAPSHWYEWAPSRPDSTFAPGVRRALLSKLHTAGDEDLKCAARVAATLTSDRKRGGGFSDRGHALAALVKADVLPTMLFELLTEPWSELPEFVASRARTLPDDDPSVVKVSEFLRTAEKLRR